MSCASTAASIAEVDTACVNAAERATKRQRTNAQRCSNASDQTVVTSADAAHTPAASTGCAAAEQQEQRMPSGGPDGHAEAALDYHEISPALLQPARAEPDRRAMQPGAFYGPPHRSPGRHGGRQTAVELRVQRFLQVINGPERLDERPADSASLISWCSSPAGHQTAHHTQRTLPGVSAAGSGV